MKYFAVAMCLLLVACNQKLVLTPDMPHVAATQYQVQSISVVPASDNSRKLGDFPRLKPFIIHRLQSEIAKMPRTGRFVDLSITMNRLQGEFAAWEISRTSSNMKSYYASGIATITDHATGDPINSRAVNVQGANNLLIGSIFSGGALSPMEESAIDNFVRAALFVAYPEQENALRDSANPRAGR